MAKGKKKDKQPGSRKKEIYQQLIIQLSTSLPVLRDILGDKKFESRVRKAARLLSAGIKEKSPKKSKLVVKKPGKKKPDTSEPPAE